MQKIYRLFFTLTVSLFLSSVVFAKAPSTYPGTDITVNNFSSYPVRVYVENLGYYYYGARTVNHIYAADPFYKRVVVYGVYGDVIFNQTVSNYYVLDIVNAMFPYLKAAK